jgi:hypothetical protein
MATLESFHGTMKRLWVHVDVETEDVEIGCLHPLTTCNLARVPELILEYEI